MAQGRVNVQYESMQSLIQIIQYQRNGAPIALIQELLRQGAEELAEACVATLDIEFDGDPNVNDYDFAHCIPEGLELDSIEAVIVCGQCLGPYDKCDACPNGWQLNGPTCITLKPCPPEQFTVCVVLRPTEACNELPDCFARHRTYFHHYVNGHLALMTDEDWGNASEARYYLRRADAKKKAAAVRGVRNYHTATQNNNDAGCLI